MKGSEIMVFIIDSVSYDNGCKFSFRVNMSVFSVGHIWWWEKGPTGVVLRFPCLLKGGSLVQWFMLELLKKQSKSIFNLPNRPSVHTVEGRTRSEL